MRGYKVRLKFTPKQESLAWWYSKVSRNFWNLLVDIDRRNNFGEFDNILNISGNKLYYSNFYERDVYDLSQSDYLKLAKIVVDIYSRRDKERWSWYYQPNQSFIYAFLVKEFVKIRRQNKGRLKFKGINEIRPNFNVRCDVFSDKRPSRIYLKIMVSFKYLLLVKFVLVLSERVLTYHVRSKLLLFLLMVSIGTCPILKILTPMLLTYPNTLKV